MIESQGEASALRKENPPVGFDGCWNFCFPFHVGLDVDYYLILSSLEIKL